jgi:PKD repeat protein
MNKVILLCLMTWFLGFTGESQNTRIPSPAINDTSKFPYWIEMMQDPSVNFFKVQRAFQTYWKDRQITKGCGWKPFKRWEYMMQWRVLPNGDRPAADVTYTAYKEYRKNIRSLNGNWVSLGPSQIPAPGPAGYEGLGRINVVAFHPTDAGTIYIGSPSGGLWQSTDGGATWVSHTDSLATLGVSAIIVDETTPSTIFIGTGDRDAGDAPGMGVFKSTDNGLSWVPWNTGMGNKVVGKMLQHPTNHMILLAATSGGIYRSTNGGSNWTLCYSANFKDIAFKPTDPNTVYAAAGASFYRSTDNGCSFTSITSGIPGGQQRGSIAVTPANPNYVYFLLSGNDSGYKGLYRSTNGGISFTVCSTSPNILGWSCDGSDAGGQGWYDLAIAVNPLNANDVYIGGVDVWRSQDAGGSWAINSSWAGGCGVPTVHADCHFLGYSPVSGSLYACDDGGVWSTYNNGVTWTDHTVGMTIGQIYKLGQSQQQKEQVINGFQDNGTYTYLGSSWAASGGGDGMECAIDYSNSHYSYYTIYYGNIYRKYNNSGDFQIGGQGIFGIDEGGAWVTPFILHATDPQTMFAGYVNVWRCNNIRGSNLTWQKISDNLGGSNTSNMAVLEQSPANTNILYAARYDNKLFRTDNCNADNPVWVNLSGSLPVSGYTPSDLASHPTDPNTVYMTLNNGVYKSVNKGQTWTNITGSLPNVHMNTIAYYKNANEGLYVGTDAGVYYKDQSLSNWVSFSQGLPVNGRITELEIYYNADTVSKEAIRASSYGRGLWGSDMYHAAPDADFTADKTLVPIGCGVNFTDLSNGVPTSWQWTFTGGNPSTSTMKNPVDIIWATAGTYSVKMKISNTYGCDSIVKSGYITVSNTLVPMVNFSSDKNVMCEGEIAHFYDSTLNCPNVWNWTFEPNTVTFLNGTTNTSQNPVVQFNQSGSYTVTLTAYNACGSGMLTKLNYILYGGYLLPFTEDFETGLDRKHWTIGPQPLGNIKWDTITVTGTSPGNKAMWINLIMDPDLSRRDQLISPPLNFSDFSSVVLQFKHAYAERGANRDSLIVKISTDCGTTWTRILQTGPDETPNVFVTHSPMDTPFYPQSSVDWCGSSYGTACYMVDLMGWAGQKNIMIMFESYNHRGNNLFLDDVEITAAEGIQVQYTGVPEIKIYPNPSDGHFTLFIEKVTGNTTMTMINPQGQIMHAELISNNKGSITRDLDFSAFARGIYYIRLTSELSTQVKKIIIK